MSKQPPFAPTANAVGPCPTLIQISRTPRHWEFTQNHRTTRPPPAVTEILLVLCSVSFLVTADGAILGHQIAKNQTWLHIKINVTQSWYDFTEIFSVSHFAIFTNRSHSD